MAPERSLIPPPPSTTTSQSTASVIGVVPPSIHSLLSSSSTSPLSGKIDQSGLSHLTHHNHIYLWEHSIQTLNEDLTPPSDSLTLIHPEYTTELSVVMVSPKPGTHHLYASSGSVVCLWIIDLHSPQKECDAHIRLSLENEYITSLTSINEWIIAATSQGNLYKLYMTSRPTSLHAKLIQKEMEDGLVRGIYNKLFTPRKTRPQHYSRGEEEGGIMALVPVYETQTAGGGDPPRNKVARTSTCRVLSITTSLVVCEWNVFLGSVEENEGCVKSKKITHCILDGLDLSGEVEMMTDPIVDGEYLIMAVRISSRDDRRIYILRFDLETLELQDSTWIDRYAGQAVQGLKCYGLVCGDSQDGCCVYVGFGPDGGECCVTVCCVRFGEERRIKDMDLFSNMIPSIVPGCFGYDSTSGGCVFLATSGLLGGASVRFPRMLPRSVLGDDVGEENVLAITSHLLSAFQLFLNKLRGGESGNTNHAAVARSVVPPSIDSCSGAVLSAAVVAASKDLLTNSGGGRSGFLSPRYKSPSPVAALREKLQLHTDFVNFLLYAGAYRKVSSTGRIKLRDHGEMMDAARACFMECQQFLDNFDPSATEEDVAKIRHELNSALNGVSDNAMDLPSCWVKLQQALAENRELFLITSLMICNGIGRALRYRQDASSLYDIPAYDISAEYSSAPWTSSPEVLQVLQLQLEDIDQTGTDWLDNSSDLDADTVTLRQLVEDMSAALLSGHRDIVMRDADNGTACQSYENAKKLCIPLLRRFANDNGDDLVALNTSLRHEHFEGIVQICHDHRKSWMRRGPFSSQKPDKTYDLRVMLQHPPDSVHNLQGCVDFTTQLDFWSYVLRWYADKGMKSKVFELGKECPEALNNLVQADKSLSELAWINDLRSGSFEKARDGLLNNPSTDLWEKENCLSIAKLANGLSAMVDRGAEIENGLTLTSAQRMLQGKDPISSDHVMSADELISLAIRNIESEADLEDKERFAIRGLEVASTLLASQRNLVGATRIWESIIQTEMPKWKSFLQESSKSVTGIPDHVVGQCKTTLYAGVCAQLAADADGRMQGIGYQTNPAVRERIRQSTGLSADMEKLLVTTAQLACN